MVLRSTKTAGRHRRWEADRKADVRRPGSRLLIKLASGWLTIDKQSECRQAQIVEVPRVGGFGRMCQVA